MDAVGTIGSKPCELSLNKILGEHHDPKLTNKVMGRLMSTKEGIKKLQKYVLPYDAAFFVHMLNIFREATYALLEQQRYSIPNEVYTHLRCCLAAYFSEAFKEFGYSKKKG